MRPPKEQVPIRSQQEGGSQAQKRLVVKGAYARYPGPRPGTTAALAVPAAGMRKPLMTYSPSRAVSKWCVAFVTALPPFI